jgi:uncharacterized protein
VTDGRHTTSAAGTDAADAAPEAVALSQAVTPSDTDTGPPKSKTDAGRVRLCVTTRTEKPADQLIRFVAGPDDRIVPDLAARLPGRGVWVTATRDAVAEAAKKGLFAKSLKRGVKADKDLAEQVENLLVAEARQVLALANKAGLVTTGFAKVESSLERGTAIALISANDASADGTGKLARKFTAIQAAAGRRAPILRQLTSAQLGLAMGGLNVIHASLTGGGLAQRLIGCCRRLDVYRMNSDGTGSAEADACQGMEVHPPMGSTPGAHEPAHTHRAADGEGETNTDQAGPIPRKPQTRRHVRQPGLRPRHLQEARARR